MVKFHTTPITQAIFWFLNPMQYLIILYMHTFKFSDHRKTAQNAEEIDESDNKDVDMHESESVNGKKYNYNESHCMQH